MNKKPKMRMILAHAAVLLWMVVIFLFSAQPGEESADLSGGISHLFMKIWNQLFGLGWDESTVLEMAGVWDFPIRKMAHMTEFGILSALIFVANKFYEKINSMKKRYMFAWIAAVVYAATDELHQVFVSGRSGNFVDVCVDAAGVTIALVVVYLVRRLYGRIRQL